MRCARRQSVFWELTPRDIVIEAGINVREETCAELNAVFNFALVDWIMPILIYHHKEILRVLNIELLVEAVMGHLVCRQPTLIDN
ncbi:hypothetical protein WK17_21345 [Burkholderia multivorans]|nr:hypothetical protein WK17_21345 [Burkholderia multivorans]